MLKPLQSTLNMPLARKITAVPKVEKCTNQRNLSMNQQKNGRREASHIHKMDNYDPEPQKYNVQTK